MIRRFIQLAALAGCLTMSSYAGDKTLMHCFAWTPVKEATAADWEAFYKASDALPKKIPGIIRVWYGKLDAPLGQVQLGNVDKEAYQKYRAGQQMSIPVSRVERSYGMCIEMKNADTLKAYDAHPYHKTWTDAYSKVRVEGTTTFNILGQ